MKVAIIGIGTIARIHIAALLRCGEQLVALCDKDTNRCRSVAETYGLEVGCYADYRQMLDECAVDAVHICTPHYLHAEMICYCLGKNVNVLCEKPIAISQAQLEQIDNAVKSSKAKLGVCQQNRYNASVTFAKQYFADKPITAACGTLCWQRDQRYYESGMWRGKKLLEGGGVAINQAIHTLDLLQWFCGMPSSVIGHTFNDKLHGVIEVEESAYGIFDCSNGCRFILNATNAAAHSFPVTLMFKSGHDEMTVMGDNVILNGKFLTKTDGLPCFDKEEWGVGHYKLINDFYRCLDTGEPFPVDFVEAQKAVKLVLALYESKGESIAVR